MPGRFPIIYVRGYAGGSGGIDQAVDDPLYGFNLGSTHVRIDGSGNPLFYQFEGPLLRLMSELGYRLFIEGGQEAYLANQADGKVAQDSVWVHRFYDTSASTWRPDQGDRDRSAGDDHVEPVEAQVAGRRPDLSEPRGFRLEDAADDLFRLVEVILRKTGAPRVHLVAHSMGGLICRSMIQRTIPNLLGRAGVPPRADGRSTAGDFVDGLFTFGTPHGGIEFDVGGGLIERARDLFGFGGADIFGPRRMYEYLTPDADRAPAAPDRWDARINPDQINFPTGRIFCLIGTNPGDYAVAMGLSARAVGVKSDGLVQVENALVTDANHAYVHRSHSGRYGLVNSEEGYQNLVRFLFGDVKVTADLANLQLPDVEDLTWQAEARVAIRGLPVLLHEQTAANRCPILIEKRRPEEPADRPVPLVTSFLWSSQALAHPRMRYTLHVRLLSLVEQVSLLERTRRFIWKDHVEHSSDFDDILVIDVEQRAAGLAAWAKWSSEIPVPLRDYQPDGEPLTDQDEAEGAWRANVPLPVGGQFLGEGAAVTLSVSRA